MSNRRPFLLRTVGTLALVGLLGLNGWLVLLNLAKHDRLPARFDDLPSLSPSGAAESASEDELAVVDDEPASFAADATVAPEALGTIEVDRWPGGRGPVPDGPPSRRQVLLTTDGSLRLVGSAPEWPVATGMVDALARRLGVDPSTIEVDVSWHPDASPRPADGDAMVEEPLRYPAGRIEIPEGSEAILAPVVSLLVAHPELFAVVVGVVEEGATGDEESALALGRASLVADELVGGGIDADRVVTSVATSESEPAASGGQALVVIRIENLLVFGSGG